MAKLITIDPGTKHIAWAAFEDSRLVRCDLVATEDSAFEKLSVVRGDVEVLIELPQVYQAAHWKGDPNDLINLATVVGQIKWAMHNARHVKTVLPHDWKGTVPKSVMGARITERLDDDEERIFRACPCGTAVRHNVIDAIGIGLWALGRLQK